MPASNRWSERDPVAADAYAARFDRLAADGADVHGEATFCAARCPSGGRILDAGCGTGRVAIRLAELGFDCVGVDADTAMLEVARRRAPGRWVLGDLSALDGIGAVDGPFDLIVAAGNVMPLVAAGSEAAVIAGLAARLAPAGCVVAGFGLDAAHLPLDEAPFGLVEYDRWCAAAGLRLSERCSTWAGEPFTDGGYAVSVHVRAGLSS